MAQYANEEIPLLISAARTATPTAADCKNVSGAGSLIVVLDLTAFTTTASLTVTIDGKDTLSGKYYNILTGAAVAATGTTRYRVSPYLPAAANTVAQDVLPPVFRITVTHGNGNSHTYSVGYQIVRG